MFDQSLAAKLLEYKDRIKNRRKRKILYRMIELAGLGYYNPLTSKVPHARQRLSGDLRIIGLKEFAQEVDDGKHKPGEEELRKFWGETPKEEKELSEVSD